MNMFYAILSIWKSSEMVYSSLPLPVYTLLDLLPFLSLYTEELTSKGVIV